MRGRRRSVLLLWSANGDPVGQWRDVRTDAPFVMWESIRYDRVPRQSATAQIVHYQTRTLVLRVPRWLPTAEVS